MKTVAASPEGVFFPGQLRELLPDQAAALVTGGFAEYVKVAPAQEAAVLAATETAAKPRAQPRRRGR